MKETIKNMAAYEAEVSVEQVKATYDVSYVARLSANESPYGSSPKVGPAIRSVSDDVLGFYPDGQATELRQAVAKLEQVNLDSLVFGAGADELIELLTRVVLTPNDNIIVPHPTFGEYAIHTRIEQATTKFVSVNQDTGHVDFDAMLHAVDEHTAMVWLANPNNPTGVFETRLDILSFLQKLPQSVILVVDEAYYDFVDQVDATVIRDVQDYPNLVVLRTLSKAYGLANLRVGYGVMQEPLYHAVQAVRLPYNLNTYQITGAVAAINDQDYLQSVVAKVKSERQKFEHFLTVHHFKYYQSQTNFLWIKVGNTKKYGERLLSQGYQVNDRLNAEWIRIALGTASDNERICQILLAINK